MIIRYEAALRRSSYLESDSDAASIAKLQSALALLHASIRGPAFNVEDVVGLVGRSHLQLCATA